MPSNGKTVQQIRIARERAPPRCGSAEAPRAHALEPRAPGVPLTRKLCLDSLREHILNLGEAEAVHEGLFALNGGLDESAFLLLESQDFFFHGAASDELVGGHDFGLANAVG